MEARHIPSMLKASFIRPGHIRVLHTMQQNSVPEQIRFPYLFYPVSCHVAFPSFIPLNLTYFTFFFFILYASSLQNQCLHCLSFLCNSNNILILSLSGN